MKIVMKIVVMLLLSSCFAQTSETYGNACVHTAPDDTYQVADEGCILGAICYIGDLRQTDGGLTPTYGICGQCGPGVACD